MGLMKLRKSKKKTASGALREAYPFLGDLLDSVDKEDERHVF